jgi:hypothetical protein
MLTVRPKQMPAVVRVLQAMPEVRVLYSISGGHDLIALAGTANGGRYGRAHRPRLAPSTASTAPPLVHHPVHQVRSDDGSRYDARPALKRSDFLKKSDFYDLPEALIAQAPLPERSASRLLLCRQAMRRSRTATCATSRR